VCCHRAGAPTGRFSPTKATTRDFYKASPDPAGGCSSCYGPGAAVAKRSASGEASFLGFPRGEPPLAEKGRAVMKTPLSLDKVAFGKSEHSHG
jgi:hypothetical protein